MYEFNISSISVSILYVFEFFLFLDIKTKILFNKMYVGNVFRYHRLSGSKAKRFLELQKLIEETRYTTYDLS